MDDNFIQKLLRDYAQSKKSKGQIEEENKMINDLIQTGPKVNGPYEDMPVGLDDTYELHGGFPGVALRSDNRNADNESKDAIRKAAFDRIKNYLNNK